MATYTDKLNLAMPDDADTADVGDFNENMGKIDEAMPIIVYSASQPEAPSEGMIWLKPAEG